MTSITRKKHDPVLSKPGWLRLYKAFVFTVAMVLFWGVSPLIAASAFDISFLGILNRLWLTLFWAAGLASLFDLKANLYRKDFYAEQPRFFIYILGLVGSIVLAIMALILRDTTQIWFRLNLEVATITSAIWSILAATAMTKAILDLNKEGQKDAPNL
jgi:hypothetical protein